MENGKVISQKRHSIPQKKNQRTKNTQQSVEAKQPSTNVCRHMCPEPIFLPSGSSKTPHKHAPKVPIVRMDGWLDD